MKNNDSKILWSFKDVVLRDSNVRVPDFEIHQGQRIALVGDCKSLRKEVFSLMCGLKTPLEGTVTIEGTEITPQSHDNPWRDYLPRSTRRKMGIALEKDGLISNVSIQECLETLFRFKYGAHNEGLLQGARRLTLETAAAFGLNNEQIQKRPSDLDPLERRLAALCLAFMTKPLILLLENPTLTLSDRGWKKLSTVLDSILSTEARTLVLETTDWMLAYKHTEVWIVFYPDKHIQLSSPQEVMHTQPEILMDALNSSVFEMRQELVKKIKMEKAA